MPHMLQNAFKKKSYVSFVLSSNIVCDDHKITGILYFDTFLLSEIYSNRIGASLYYSYELVIFEWKRTF